MVWIVIFFAVIAVCLDSLPGKLSIGCGVAAIGFLLLAWITGAAIFITLAKVCAVMIVIVVFGCALVSIAK